MSGRKPLLTDGRIAVIIVALVLVVDQIIKIVVKTNMHLGEAIHVTDWFYIDFVENNGMAYGMTFMPKLFLSLFRIVAVSVIGWYISKVVKAEHRRGYVVCLALILAGAAGNIIDSMFYGMVFSPSTPFSVAEWVPFGEGYSSFLQGKVVDMFYFPLIVTTLPDWLPVWGGEEYIFFSPVFNFADSCITVGVILLLIFFRRELENISATMKPKNSESQEEINEQ